MTAAEFIAKFPRARRNQNALEDVACPSCGQRESFRIEATLIAILRDEGTDRDESDCEYDDGAYCECGDEECRFHGKFADFLVEGLDEILELSGGVNLTAEPEATPVTAMAINRDKGENQ